MDRSPAQYRVRRFPRTKKGKAFKRMTERTWWTIEANIEGSIYSLCYTCKTWRECMNKLYPHSLDKW